MLMAGHKERERSPFAACMAADEGGYLLADQSSPAFFFFPLAVPSREDFHDQPSDPLSLHTKDLDEIPGTRSAFNDW